jgi:hypothetical protein
MKTPSNLSAGTMTNPLGLPAPRQLVCSACGTEFSCGLSRDCWCAEESARLPMPAASDCLCRNCLRAMADQASRNAAG